MNSINDTISYKKQLERSFLFVEIIKELLIKLKYKNVYKYEKLSDKYSADIIFGELEELSVVEIKSYRPLSKPSMSLIEEAHKQLQKFL